MPARTSWYGDHPPYCTCKRCQDTRLNHLDRVSEWTPPDPPWASSRRQPRRRGRKRAFRILAGLIVLVPVVLLIGGAIFWPNDLDSLLQKAGESAQRIVDRQSNSPEGGDAGQRAESSAPKRSGFFSSLFSSNKNKVNLTESGNPSVVWTTAPELRNRTLRLEGTVDDVVSTNDLSVTLYHQSEDSRETFCDVRGKPWMKVVEPLPAGSYYVGSATSMWCTVTYGRRSSNNRVSGDSRYGSPGASAEKISFPFQEADVWGVKGKAFRIEVTLKGLDRPGVHSVELWAGSEVLVVYELEPPASPTP